MAGTFDSSSSVSVGVTPTLIYQPTTAGVVMSCMMANAYFGRLPITAYILRGAQKIYLANPVDVAAGATVDLLNGSKVAFAIGDSFYASCPIAGAFSCLVSAYKDQ